MTTGPGDASAGPGGSKPDSSIENARKELVEAWRRYSQDARQNQSQPPDNLTLETLEHEYERLEKRWRLVRQQLRRVFKEGRLAESQLPGLHVELKLAAEQAARAYAMLAAL